MNLQTIFEIIGGISLVVMIVSAVYICVTTKDEEETVCPIHGTKMHYWDQKRARGLMCDECANEKTSTIVV